MAKQVLLNVSDGPEYIEIYADDVRGVVDWSNAFPAVYLRAGNMDASVQLGPFHLSNIYHQLRAWIRDAPLTHEEQAERLVDDLSSPF